MSYKPYPVSNPLIVLTALISLSYSYGGDQAYLQIFECQVLNDLSWMKHSPVTIMSSFIWHELAGRSSTSFTMNMFLCEGVTGITICIDRLLFHHLCHYIGMSYLRWPGLNLMNSTTSTTIFVKSFKHERGQFVQETSRRLQRELVQNSWIS